MKVELCAVVVIYNRDYYNTETYKSLRKCVDRCKNSSIFTIIYDNSSQPQIVTGNNCIYVHDPSNRGVIPAYRYALKYCKENNIDWMFRLDQDSIFDEKLIYEFFSILKRPPSHTLSAIVPKILCNGTVISPSVIKKGGFMGEIDKNTHGVYKKKITFINSMSFINVNDPMVTDAITHTNFMLDLSDHDVAYRLDYHNIYIMNLLENHSLSVSEKSYVNKDRYTKILDAEFRFAKEHFEFSDRAVFYYRLIMRVLKNVWLGRYNIALITIKVIWNHVS